MAPLPPANGKAHRQTESTSNATSTTQLNSAIPAGVSQTSLPSAFASLGPAAPWQEKLMHAFIQRIKLKLPCYSGLSLFVIEDDDALKKTIDTLVYMGRTRLGQVAVLLLELLDKLTKHPGDASVPVLQSELFVLKILSLVMTARWDAHRDEAGLRNGGGFTPATPNSAFTSRSRRSGAHPSENAHTEPGDWVEPPPFDDDIAAYILSVMVPFLRQAAPLVDRPPDSAHVNSDSSYHAFEIVQPAPPQQAEPTGPDTTIIVFDGTKTTKTPTTTIPVDGSSPGRIAAPGPPPPGPTLEPTPPTLLVSPTSLNLLILKFTGRILFHLSASNWQAVFARIRTKIHALARATESGVDTIEVKLIAYAALDRVKLVQILQELSSLLVNMQPDAQCAVALALRSALWNWISVFPSEFADAAAHPRRLEGAADRVYDLLMHISDEPRKRAFWPTVTLLLCTNQDRMKQVEAALAGAKQVKVKKGPTRVGWMEVSKALLATSRLSEAAIVCYSELCRAAMFVATSVPGDVPVRSLAPDLAQELRVRLVSPPAPLKPFWESLEPIDVGLYADAIVAIYRSDPNGAVRHVLLPALQPTRSDAIKICAVKATLTLFVEEKRLPNQVTLGPLYNLAKRIRLAFLASCQRISEKDERGAPLRAAATPAAKKFLCDTLPDRDLFLLSCLALWRSSLPFFLWDAVRADMKTFCMESADLLRYANDADVRMSASRTFGAVFFNSSTIPPDSPMYAAAQGYHIQGTIEALMTCALQLLESPDNMDVQRLHLPIVQMLLFRYSDESVTDDDGSWKYAPERIQSFLAAEIALLFLLASPDLELSTQACSSLRLLATAERSPHAPRPRHMTPEEQAKRWAVYEQLGDTQFQLVGRLVHQKRLRQLLRALAVPWSTNIAVWESCYRRWATLKGQIVGADDQATKQSEVSDDTRAAWQNLTYYLAALAGSCVTDGTDVRPLDAVLPKQLHHLARPSTQPLGLAKKFINELMDLLEVQVAMARETAKDALGSELHPKLFPLFLFQLDQAIIKCFDPNSDYKGEDGVPIFVEQCISVLKLMLDRMEAPPEISQLNVDLSRMVLHLARFIARGDTSKVAMRVKIRFCALCGALFAKRRFLAIRKETSLRNSLVDKLFEWITDSHLLQTGETPHLRLQAESDVACLRTVVDLLENLRLEPPESTTSSDSANILSRLFNRYSNIFLSISGAGRTASSTDDISDTYSSFSNTKLGGRDEGVIRELVVKGMVNMLEANTDAGSKHCLQLGSQDNVRMKLLFAHIFSRVLARGAKLEVSSPTAAVAPRSQLCEMLRESDMMLALAVCEICPTSEVDIVIPVLLNVFDTRESLSALMKAAIDREVARTDSDKELFRANTVCTRLLGAFAKKQGYDYLRAILQPIIDQMCRLPLERSFEIDPHKAPPGEDTDANMRNLKVVTQALLDVICDSTPKMPLIMMDVCKHIASAVGSVWPASRQAALGAFLFLRFICPAIVAPETVDIEIPPGTRDIRRGLILITKIVQNLANNVLFGKEQYLVVLNAFLEQNVRKVQTFCESLVKPSSADELVMTEHDVGACFDETDSIVLQRFFHFHADKIGKELLSFSRPSSDTDTANITGKKTWDSLCASLVELGQPVERPQQINAESSRHTKYLEFMQRLEKRSVESVRNIFAEAPTPKDRPLVFILSLARLNVETEDLELVLLLIFKTLIASDAMKQPFDIIIDCTAFPPSSEIPLPWLKLVIELLPLDIVSQFQTAYIFNPNGIAQNFLRKALHAFATIPFAKHIVTVSSLKDLGDVLHTSSMSTMAYCTSLEREPKESFEGVTQLLRGASRVPVKFQLGMTHLRVTSTRSQQLFPGVNCKTTEVIPLGDISDVTQYSATDRSPDFTIRQSRLGGILIFSSPFRDPIIKAIRLAKTRMKAQESANTIDRTSRNWLITTSLMNSGLHLLCHEDENLRSAAHDLLCSLCTYLDYDGVPILPTRGGFIPANPAAVAIPFSEKLAQFTPQLTIEFLCEVCLTFDKLDSAQKSVALQLAIPWLKNLPAFASPLSPHHDMSGSKLRDCLRCIVDLTIKDHELYPQVQKHMWYEIGKLETSLVAIALDELLRAAIDAGIGSMRCELVADTLGSLSSVVVHGKIITRLRKAFAKTSLKPTRSLVDNPAWQEITALTRLALVAGYNTRAPIQTLIYVPETAHLIAILASVGPLIMRTSVHGLLLNLIQSMFAARRDDPASARDLGNLLDQASAPELLRCFGLGRVETSSDFTVLELQNDVEAVDALESIIKFTLRLFDVTGSSTLVNVWRARWMGLVVSTAFQLSPYIQGRAFTVLGVLAASDVDDDLLYQILVAFKNAISIVAEIDSPYIVSMLRCIRNIVPALPADNSRYLAQLFWQPVALLQTPYTVVFGEALRLLEVIVETLYQYGHFQERGLVEFLLDVRQPLEEEMMKLDLRAGLSFDSNFSFALASLIFKGLQAATLREQSQETLRKLLRITTMSARQMAVAAGHDLVPARTLDPDGFGYFLALFPLASQSREKTLALLGDAELSEDWLPVPADAAGRTYFPLNILGTLDSHMAVLICGFITMIAATSLAGQSERGLLNKLLCDLANVWPEHATMTLAHRAEHMPDSINDVYSSAVDPVVLAALTGLLKMTLDDAGPMRGELSALEVIGESAASGPGRNLLLALEEMGMQGMLSMAPFATSSRDVAVHGLQHIPELIGLIIDTA